MNNKFPVLSCLSIILKISGWLLIIIGLYFAVYGGLIEPRQPGHIFGTQNQFELIGGSISVILGLIVAMLGESIGVLFAIEENTRQ